MAITFVKATKLEASTGNNCSGSVTWTAGDQLVTVGTASGASANPVASGGGGTWTADAGGAYTGGRAGISSNPNPTGTGATITVTATGGNGVTASVLEFSGAYSSGAMADNTSPAIKTGTSSPASTNSESNNTANAVFVAVLGSDDSVSASITGTGTGWTYPANAQEAVGTSFEILSGGYKIVSSVVSESSAWTENTAAWGAVIAVYKAAAAGGAAVQDLLPLLGVG